MLILVVLAQGLEYRDETLFHARAEFAPRSFKRVGIDRESCAFPDLQCCLGSFVGRAPCSEGIGGQEISGVVGARDDHAAIYAERHSESSSCRVGMLDHRAV